MIIEAEVLTYIQTLRYDRIEDHDHKLNLIKNNIDNVKLSISNTQYSSFVFKNGSTEDNIISETFELIKRQIINEIR